MYNSEFLGDYLPHVDLQTLSQTRADSGLVLSLYMDLGSVDGTIVDLPRQFDRMLLNAETQKKLDLIPTADRVHLDKEVAHLRSWLSSTEISKSQGLAVISSQSAGLWHVFYLPVPVMNQMVVSDRPYIRPLDVLKREFTCSLVFLVDSSTVRMDEVFLGQVEEVDRIEAVPVTGDDPEDSMSQFAKYVVGKIESAWDERGCTRLIIGGDDEMVTEIVGQLPESFGNWPVAEISLSPQARNDEISAQVSEIEGELERLLEMERIEELITGAKKNQGEAVLGLEQTLLSVRTKIKSAC